jgi:glucokinase
MKTTGDLLLAGDIGGTNARLRLCDRKLRTVDEAVFPSAGAPSLANIVGRYLRSRKAKVSAAVLGIAGPVIGGAVRATNLPWKADEKSLARDLGIPKLKLVNDLAALAVGCTEVGRASKVVIAKGRAAPSGNMAVIAAGTGLGEALLVWDGRRFLPSPTEGGHSDFAPTSDIEIELLTYLAAQVRGGHVSNEYVLSGPGIGRIYDFLVERDRSSRALESGMRRDGASRALEKERRGGRSSRALELPMRGDRTPKGRRAPASVETAAVESAAVERALAKGDRNAAITELGLSGKSRYASAAVDLFASIYGAEAGNLVLRSLAIGGLYVCGGIAARVLPAKKPLFLASMRNKGRLSKLLSAVPVTLVEDPLVGLIGAGHLAARLAAE